MKKIRKAGQSKLIATVLAAVVFVGAITCGVAWADVDDDEDDDEKEQALIAQIQVQAQHDIVTKGTTGNGQ